jgi:ADP-heptose:LPS heptosyltransferase
VKETRIKKLERAWKRFCFSVIFAAVDRRPQPPLPDWRHGPRRVLFIRPDGIGDAIVSTNLFRAVAGLSDHMTVDVIGSPANASFLQQLPYIRNVYVFNKRRRGALIKLGRVLRQTGYDAAIDLRITPPSLTGLLLMLASGAPHRFGVAGRGVDRALTVRIPPSGGHIIEQIANFGEPFGIEGNRLCARPILPIRAEAEQWARSMWDRQGRTPSRRVLVNVSAGESTRSWVDERYVATIRALRSADPDVDVVVIGAPTEWGRTQSIASSARSRAVATPSLHHLVALTAAADIVFTPDTCVAHIASGFEKPTVAMYLRNTAWQWGAYQTGGVNLESPTMHLDTLDAAQPIACLTALLQPQTR